MLARDLTGEGHEVHLFCRDLQTTPPTGVSVHRMPWIPLGPGLGRIAFSNWAQRAVRHVEQVSGRFDITHGFGRTVGQDVYRMGGGCHATYLEHAHALEYPFWLRRLLRRAPLQRLKASFESRMLSSDVAPHIITNSQMSRSDVLHRYSVPQQHMHVVRNGIDLERFRPPEHDERERVRAMWGLDESHDVLLFLGSGYSRKGLEVLLRSAASLVAENPKLRLVVGGQDHRMRRWRRLAERLGLSHVVTWLGPVSEPELSYRGADVYVLPTSYDPAANSTLEALASGLPVVTSAMNGASEILDPELHGSVLDTPIHPAELRSSLVSWLERAGTAEVRDATRALARHFPARSSCKSTLDVYRAVLEDRSTRLHPPAPPSGKPPARPTPAGLSTS